MELKTLTWGLIRTALLPIQVRRLELVTEEDKESSSEEEVICNVVEEPAMKVLPTAPLEDLLLSRLLTSTVGAFLLAGCLSTKRARKFRQISC